MSGSEGVCGGELQRASEESSPKQVQSVARVSFNLVNMSMFTEFQERGRGKEEKSRRWKLAPTEQSGLGLAL